MRRFEKILVANRGEIARRVLRTVREMGLSGAAVYSTADAAAPHVAEADEAVWIGPPESGESYLAIDRILDAARTVDADAIHPGYGFLSENAEFAARCAEAGIAFIGPRPEALHRMGSKIEAKVAMEAAGIPVIPGVSGAGLEDRALAREARKIGFPILVKASAGGGGRGMRLARDRTALPEALAAARREARGAFGDDALLLERYLEAPRHIEVQVVGDEHGHVVHCFERECSIQRRYQKIVEEAPSPSVDEALRHRMGAAAVSAAKAIDYVGAGTVEFLVDDSGAFYFLEMNTRLQVEHPVTEEVTGLDLVRLQILVAQGAPLPVSQEDLAIDGHAIEARLYAEDPRAGFLPTSGRIALWEPAVLPGVRVESGVAAGTDVGVHYDALLAKIVAQGQSRDEARRRLVRALRMLGVGGVSTNRDLLLAVLTHPAFEAGRIDTHFLERHLPPEALAARSPAADRQSAVAATLWEHECRRRRPGPLPRSIPSGWRNNRWRPQEVQYRIGEATLEVRYVAASAGRFAIEAAGERSEARVAEAAAGELSLELDGVRHRFRIAAEGERVFVHGPLGTTELVRIPRFPPPRGAEIAGGCVAPMPGVVRQVCVAVGDRVAKGTVLLVLEAMKMEHPLIAHAAGVVKEVRVEVGQMVDPDAVLIVVEGEE